MSALKASPGAQKEIDPSQAVHWINAEQSVGCGKIPSPFWEQNSLTFVGLSDEPDVVVALLVWVVDLVVVDLVVVGLVVSGVAIVEVGAPFGTMERSEHP